MRIVCLIRLSLLIALVDWSLGCVSHKVFQQAPQEDIVHPVQGGKKRLGFHQQVQTTIPIFTFSAEGELNADVYRPQRQSLPKTLVIMVPGSGNISRQGEQGNDGLKSYESEILINQRWAHALADRGLFVLSYDKRTCSSGINPICLDNDQSDIHGRGMVALAQDLDQVIAFSRDRFSKDDKENRIVLMSSTQGAQVISLSKSMSTVSGIVLLSPIIDDLATMWVAGLSRAADRAEEAGHVLERNRLLNRKESTDAFFKSLKKGDFPSFANIKGASVTFWQSWMEASINTLNRLEQSKVKTFLLFSEQDPFVDQKLMSDLTKKPALGANIAARSLAGVDRNFLSGQDISDSAVAAVIEFMDSL